MKPKTPVKIGTTNVVKVSPVPKVSPVTKSSTGGTGSTGGHKTARQIEQEKLLSPVIEDFLAEYEDDLESLDPWAQELVTKLANQIREKIRIHWKESAKTRRMFTNIPAETVWEDEATKTMILSRKNFTLFDAGFLPSLEEYILSQFKDLIETIRAEVRSILHTVHADQEEIARVEEHFKNTTPSGYSFSEYGKHLDISSNWRSELKARYPVIEYCRQREEFLLQLLKWEEENKNLVTAKGTSSILRWVPQFRNDVIRVYKESSAVASKLLADAEGRIGRPVKIDGTSYSEILKKQDAQVPRIKTTFLNFKYENLFFLEGEEGQYSIRPRILDPSLVKYLKESDALQQPNPPPAPLHSAEVHFQVVYS